MTLIKYNPSRNVESRSFSSMLDQFFNDAFKTDFEKSTFTPQVDISETKDEFQVELAVPGMKKEDFKIDVQNDQLVISGERSRKEVKEEKNYHSLETYYGSFRRSFYLPENIKEEKIEATYQDGILNIRIPKDEKKELIKTIQVK